MKKSGYMAICLCVLITFSVNAQKEAKSDNEILYADPSIYTENGMFYLIGTRNHAPIGFTMLESKNLKEWKSPDAGKDCVILEKGKGVFGTKGFWAPQIIKEKDTYYLAYTASQQIAIATSKSLTGPYTQALLEPLDNSANNIDPFIFKDNDGKFYLYHVRFNHGNYIWVAELDLQQCKIKVETLKKCFGQTDAWEMTPNYTSAPIMEGPTVIKREGVYYLFYSANHFMSIDYAVGYATASSPYGPWTKATGNPIIHRSVVGENGSGHGDVFWDTAGKPYYVYHVHQSDSTVSPRRTRIVPLTFNKDKQTGTFRISANRNKVIVPKEMKK